MRVGVLQFRAVCPEGNEHSLACGITHEIARRLTTSGGMEASAILLGNGPGNLPVNLDDSAEASLSVERVTGLSVPTLGARFESDYILQGLVHIADGINLVYHVYEVKTGSLIHHGSASGLRTSVFRLLQDVALAARSAIGYVPELELSEDFDPVFEHVNFEAFVEYCLGRDAERPQEALEHLETALAVEPSFRSALVEYLSTCYQIDRMGAALRYIDTYLDGQPEDAEMLIAGANMCLSYNRVEDGLGYATRCLTLRPHDVEPRLLMARFLFAREEVREARRHLEIALRSTDRSPEGRYCLGRYYLDLGDVYRARDYFEQCLQVDPEYLVALRDLQCCYYELGDFREGIEVCERLLELDPTDAGSQYNLGLIYQRLGRTHLARKFYEEAIRQDPTFYKAHFMIGEYHHARGEHERALESFDEAQRVSGGTAEALGRVADCHFELGNLREAYRHYVWARRADSLFDSARFHLIEGLTLAEDGNLREARARLVKAVELDERLVEGWNELGWVLLRLGRAEEAVDVLRKAVELEPEDPALLRNLLVCCGRLPLGVRFAGWARQLTRETRSRLRDLSSRGIVPSADARRRLRRFLGVLTWYGLRG